MPLSLTAFGLTGETVGTALCYLLLRSVRGRGDYPSSNLDASTGARVTSGPRLAGTSLQIVICESLLDGPAEQSAIAQIDNGVFTLPSTSLLGGQSISGTPFGPLVRLEGSPDARVSGRGILHHKGIAPARTSGDLLEFWKKDLLAGDAAAVLDHAIQQLSLLSGIHSHHPLFGGLDYFYRSIDPALLDGHLFEVIPVKPTTGTKSPMLQVRVQRRDTSGDEHFRLHVVLSYFDAVLCASLYELPSGTNEIVCTAPDHITDISIDVFDQSGVLVDHIEGQFLQGTEFNLKAVGSSDALPPPFKGALYSADLQKRVRSHTTSSKGPSVSVRTSGLNLRKSRLDTIEERTGGHTARRESRWFARGTLEQLEVIRWIKERLEDSRFSKAYLVDPFLGSEAMSRVVVRQGNVAASLTILVSPGNIDPDAEVMDACATSSHLTKLRDAADALENLLAGRISIVHIKRGEGSRQAFHDRYLCLIDQRGYATAYLLSNSLNKAAGIWPFAISELSRITSERVHAYILTLLNSDGHSVEAVWSSPNSTGELFARSEASAVSESTLDKALIHLWEAVIANSRDRSGLFIGEALDQFCQTAASCEDDEKSAAIFDNFNHRPILLARFSTHLRSSSNATLAAQLDQKLLLLYLSSLPTPDERSAWHFAADEAEQLSNHLASVIAAGDRPTNFVRNKLNPKLDQLVCMIEHQRINQMLLYDALDAAMSLAAVAIEVAVQVNEPESYRVGMSTDYIHWVGRLMRSDTANIYTSRVGTDERRTYPCLLARKFSTVRTLLGPKLDEPITLVMNDPVVPNFFKQAFKTF